MEAALNDLMNWIAAHPHWAGLFVLIVSALESFLVVGLFVPGTVVMFGIGAMIAAGSMELMPTLIWAAIGAIIGDGTSYFIGRYYHQRLRVMWPFRNYPNLIANGVDFFHKHGGKSIVMARFVGPVRPLVPAVAGMLDMPAGRFFLVNVLSAIVWAPAYILPGVLFGASLGVATEIAGRLALLLIILVALLWFSWWLMRRLARSMQPHAQAVQYGILDWSRGRRYFHPLVAALLDPEHPEARGMTVLTLLLIIASWLLLTIPANLSPNNLLGNLDLYIFHMLAELHSPFGDRLMIMVSSAGSSFVLYSFTALLSAWLIWRRRWRAAIHWLITVTVVSLLTHALKIYTAVERPTLFDTSGMSYAFPSAHASVSVAVFGFLAVAIARELRSNWHWVPYSVAVFLVVSIGFSRLYLGAHWFSDILGGWSLGLAWVALMGIAYRQHATPHIAAGIFTPLAVSVLVALLALYSSQKFAQELAFYKPQTVQTISLKREEWLDSQWRSLPVYRDDLEGRHIHPLDIQWLAPLAAIEARLEQRGFRTADNGGTLGLLDLFNSDAQLHDLPVLPQVHHGETQKLLRIRDSEDGQRLLAIRLWKTEYRDDQNGEPLWIGNASFLKVDTSLQLLRVLRTGPDYQNALDTFAATIDDLRVKRVTRQALPQPAAATEWDGTLLLIDGD